jgi:hypothetical protein
MNVTPKSLNNGFQIQASWKGKDSSFLSWTFDLKRKMVQFCEILEKQVMKVQHFYIANLDIPRSHNDV